MHRKKLSTCALLIVLALQALLACAPSSPQSGTPTTVVSQAPAASATLADGGTVPPKATLNPTDAALQLKELIANNDYCLVPCVWGIIPGETTLGEAELMFAQLGGSLTQTLETGALRFYEAAFGPKHGLENGLSMQIILSVENELVKNLRAYIKTSDGENFAPRDRWAAYSPEWVLRRYGIPSRVDFMHPIGPDSLPAGEVWYFTRLYFDPLKLIVEYESGIEYPARVNEDGSVGVCLTKDPIRNVRIWLGENPETPPSEGFSLVDFSAVTLQQYYDALAIGEGCIELSPHVFFP